MSRNYYEILAQRHQGKGTVKQLNSRAKKVIIDLDYSNNYEYLKDNCTKELAPTDSIIFHVDCINISCTKGYLDLTHEIESMLRTKSTKHTEKMNCGGYQDE